MEFHRDLYGLVRQPSSSGLRVLVRWEYPQDWFPPTRERDNRSLITAWETFNFDWSTIHSYRRFRDTSGVVNVYVDGEVVPSLSIPEAQLPFLEELNDSFNEIQNIFFGALSREATSISVWDFVHYLVLPTNPQQSIPSAFA